MIISKDREAETEECESSVGGGDGMTEGREEWSEVCLN